MTFQELYICFTYTKVKSSNKIFASAPFLKREIHGDDILNKFSSCYCNDVCLAIPWELQLASTLINSLQFSCVIDTFYILRWIKITPA